MKHLTCDLCGKPAPKKMDYGEDPKFYLFGNLPGEYHRLEVCEPCGKTLSTAIHAKCAELKKASE